MSCKSQTLRVYAMTHATCQVPLHGSSRQTQLGGGNKHSLRRDYLIAIAMGKQNWWDLVLNRRRCQPANPKILRPLLA